MPAAVPKLIKFKVTNGNLGEYVKVTNVTSGGTLTGKLNSSGECELNPADEGLTWSEGDKVQGSISGRINQCAEKTITKGGCTFNFTTSATSSMANVNL
ncbi:MAG: hypothetical protein ACTSX6_04790 [Candidatus Heimdallarchaeaceae archaeon]